MAIVAKQNSDKRGSGASPKPKKRNRISSQTAVAPVSVT
ncbi:hypothetical protein PC116_g17141 [Phytophthora cactorum]|nr:hypothetical protein C6341_g9004 [Phytophthora cactorum]KAG4234702.1 hypothetical protein PC116_g17141 [Phytophthora cactorum]